MSFASATNLMFSEQMAVAKRRLVQAKDDGGKRAFYVAEIFQVDDEPLNLLVMPRTPSATPELCARSVTKDPEATARVSSSTVTLLEGSGGSDFHVAGDLTRSLLVQKVHIRNGHNGLTIFYGQSKASTTQTPSEPWSLGLDHKTTIELQRAAAGLLGAQLVDTKRRVDCTTLVAS